MIGARVVDAGAAMMARDVTTVVIVDVTRGSAEAGVTEAQRASAAVVQHTVGRVRGTGQIVRRARYQLCQHPFKDGVERTSTYQNKAHQEIQLYLGDSEKNIKN